MPIGSSGPIKLSEIRDTFGVAAGAVYLSGGSTPTGTSCFGKAQPHGVNQAAPHAFSEFRLSSDAYSCGSYTGAKSFVDLPNGENFIMKFSYSSSGNASFTFGLDANRSGRVQVHISLKANNATGTTGNRGYIKMQDIAFTSGFSYYNVTGSFALPYISSAYICEVRFYFYNMAGPITGSITAQLMCPTNGEACGSQKTQNITVCPGYLTDYQNLEGIYIDVGTTSGTVPITWSYSQASYPGYIIYVRLYYGGNLVYNQMYDMNGASSVGNTFNYTYSYNATYGQNLLLTVYDANCN